MTTPVPEDSVAHASWRVCDDDHTSNYHNRNSNCFSEKRLTAAGMARKHLDEVQGGESIELAVPHPPPSYPASVRPNVRQGLFHRTPGRSDGPTHERQLGQYTEEKPLASDARTVRTLVEHGGRRRRRATEKPSLVPFSSPPLYHCQKRPYRICSGFWLCSGKMLRTLANPGAALPWGIAWLHLSSVFVDSFGPPWPPRH